MSYTSKAFCAALMAALLLTGSASPAAAAHWGEFRDDGCIHVGDGRQVRVYQSVLWGIPWGHSWEEACANQPADVAGVHFDHPTACVKSSVAQALGVIATALGASGLALEFPPLGVAAAVVGVTTAILNLGEWGALNMWGIFYVNGAC
jgi:hypothetical protein